MLKYLSKNWTTFWIRLKGNGNCVISWAIITSISSIMNQTLLQLSLLTPCTPLRFCRWSISDVSDHFPVFHINYGCAAQVPNECIVSRNFSYQNKRLPSTKLLQKSTGVKCIHLPKHKVRFLCSTQHSQNSLTSIFQNIKSKSNIIIESRG